MHTEPNTDRIIRAWLRAEEPVSAARVLRSVIAGLDATPQVRSVSPAPWFAGRNALGKLAAGTAALLVVSAVGLAVLPGGGWFAGGSASGPGPAVCEHRFMEECFPPSGPLAVGDHTWAHEWGEVLQFRVPSRGWVSSGLNSAGYGGSISKGTVPSPDGAVITFGRLDNVYADPCRHTLLDPAVGPTVDDLAAALTAIPGTQVIVGPSRASMPRLGETPATTVTYVALNIREDMDCDPNEFYLWTAVDEGPRRATAPGSTIKLWIFQEGEVRVVIEAETYGDASPQIEQEIVQIVQSIAGPMG